MHNSVSPPTAQRATFGDYWAAGFGPHILPIIPPRATISPLSNLDAGKLGKTPGKWTPAGYVGFRQWPDHQTDIDDVERWDGWPATTTPPSIALQGRAYPAVDIDVNDPSLAERLKARVLQVAGPAPARHVADATGKLRSRLALFYRSESPIAQWRVEFATRDGELMMVEFKGDRTQVVVEGAHVKGGAYCYPDGQTPADWGAAGLSLMTPDISSSVRSAIIAELEAAGCSVQATSRSAPRSIDAGSQAISAPSLAHVAAALEAAPNGDDLDRADWVAVAHFVKGSCVDLEEDGYELFSAWSEALNTPESIAELWAGLPDRPRSGWPELQRWAKRRSNGAFRTAPTEFDTVISDTAALREAAIEEMFATNMWVENQERVYDLRDQRLRNRQQFNLHWAAIGKPTDKGKCAWDVFTNEPDKPSPLHPTARRQTVFDMTYMPGAALLVGEGAERRVNLWRAPQDIPDCAVTDDDVRLWLDHVALIVPDAKIRGLLLDWMASVVQRQNEKPNHGVVIGGGHGIGKSLLIEPLRRALGLHNVQEILASELDSTYSGWLQQAKLFIVEEMMNFQKKEMMQRLKTYLAAPPHTLQVNPKYGKTFTIPNLVAGIFFTNHEDAVAVEPGERRFFIIWSDAQKQPPSYFSALTNWYSIGGAALAARWLLQRDISGYNMLGEAPHTTARDDMRKAGLSKLDEWVEASIEDAVFPFDCDLVALDDVRAHVPQRFWPVTGSPTANRLSSALKGAGAVLAHHKDSRPALGAPPPECRGVSCSPKQARIYAVRNHESYVRLSNAELVAEFWIQRLGSADEHKLANVL